MNSPVAINAIESALIQNDLSKLTPDQRLSYYKEVCDSVGLNHMTQPLAYIILNQKLTLYAKKEATDQLRKIHGISIRITSREKIDGLYIVTAQAEDKTGRQDEATGVVDVAGLKGADLANAMLKAETKAKRRVTLSISGMGMLDVTEIEDIPREAKAAPFNNDPFGKKQAALNAAQATAQDAEVVQESAPSQELSPDDLGAYVVKIGKNYKGKALRDIDPFQLNGFLDWLHGNAAKTNKPLTGDAAELVEVAEAYLKSLEKRPE